jgi:anti-anti-sigma factor
MGGVAGVNGSYGDRQTWFLAGSISVQPEGQETVLCLVGEIDGLVVAQFEESVGHEYPAVDAFDAGATTFLSSAALRLVLAIRERSLASGRPAVLRSTSPALDRILDVTGLTEVFGRPAQDPP